MAFIDDVKIYLRVSTAAYNTEITDLISAAKADLALAGIYTVSETDFLYKQAICLYCKAHFGYDNSDADRLADSYDEIKRKLMLTLEHGYYTVTFTASSQCEIEFDGETKETNSSGVAVFYHRAGNHLPYYVAGAGPSYVDVAADTEVDLT